LPHIFKNDRTEMRREAPGVGLTSACLTNEDPNRRAELDLWAYVKGKLTIRLECLGRPWCLDLADTARKNSKQPEDPERFIV